MAETPTLTFGEELRRERLIRNVPLDEISAATKISIRLLTALEASDVSKTARAGLHARLHSSLRPASGPRSRRDGQRVPRGPRARPAGRRFEESRAAVALSARAPRGRRHDRRQRHRDPPRPRPHRPSGAPEHERRPDRAAPHRAGQLQERRRLARTGADGPGRARRRFREAGRRRRDGPRVRSGFVDRGDLRRRTSHLLRD